ncbi:hypothetical protein INR49_002575 [Caranx melampygus]|nr:hypothetical protein INR49_002575 [Caranx melampygus]
MALGRSSGFSCGEDNKTTKKICPAVNGERFRFSASQHHTEEHTDGSAGGGVWSMKNTTQFEGFIYTMKQHCDRMDGRGLLITFSPVTNSLQSYKNYLKPRVLASRAGVELWVNRGSSPGPVHLFTPRYLSW